MSTPIDKEKYPPVGDGVKLPGLAAPTSDVNQLRNVVETIKEIVEIREGRRGSKYDQVVTWRDLYNIGLIAVNSGGQTYINSIDSSGVTGVTLMSPSLAKLMVDQFDKKIKSTQVYQDIFSEIGKASSYKGVPQEVVDILISDLAEEAKNRGADIQRVDQRIQEVDKSLAITTQTLTASIDNAQAAIREVSFASVNRDQASAGKVTTLVSSLGNYYQDGGTGRAQLEQTLTTQADRITGLRAQYTVKVKAGGSIAGFGLAATEVDGVPSSAFIIAADKFAIVSPSYTGGVTNTPDNNIIPFGVDADGIYMNTNVYIKGSMRVDTGGKVISDGLRGSLNLAVTASAWSDTSARQAVWAALGKTGDATSNNHLVIGDTVTISSGQTPPTFIQTKYWSGSAWATMGVSINGNLLVSGSISADQIDTRGLSIKDSSGNVIFSAGTSLSTSRITGLGTLASQNSVSYSSLDGTKPPNDATRNIVTFSATEPSAPVNGDIWVDTSTNPYVIKTRTSGVWNTGANYTTNTNQLTDGASLGQTSLWTGVTGTGRPADNATKNIFSQGAFATRPTGSDGDLFYSTDSFQLYQKVAGAWELAANNTSVDATGAIRGTSSGAGTVVANSKIQIDSAGNLTGAGGGTVTISGLGYSGALDATRNVFTQGTIANLPSGLNGDVFFATDTNQLYQKISGSWVLSANKTFVDADGTIKGVSTGAGTAVANSVITITNGVINGIGTGSGTAVANNLITLASNGTLSGAGGGTVTITGLGYSGALDATKNVFGRGLFANRPTGSDGDLYLATDTRQLYQKVAGSWSVAANDTYVDTDGTIKGTSAGSGTVVSNSQITITNGAITGIGTGNNTSVANSLITLSSSGSLSGAGGGTVTITGLGYSGALDATKNVFTQGTFAARPAGSDGDVFYATDNSQLYQKISGAWVLSANNTYVDAGGVIRGTSVGSGTSVANSLITITDGAITGIGAGANTKVANSEISISASGVLSGAGGGTVTISGLDNTVLRSANPITSTNVGTYINTGAITNAYIGQFIQSTNYSPGVSGWQIDKSGSAELNDATFRGSIAVGSAPTISGSSMTGSGARITSSGTFALGNSTTNIAFNGSSLYLNGDVVATGNLQANSVTTTAYTQLNSNLAFSSYATGDVLSATLNTGGKPVLIIYSFYVVWGSGATTGGNQFMVEARINGTAVKQHNFISIASNGGASFIQGVGYLGDPGTADFNASITLSTHLGSYSVTFFPVTQQQLGTYFYVLGTKR